MDIRTDKLDSFLDDIEKLKKAKLLLDKVWIEMISEDKSLSDKLRYEIQDYYHYDDNE
jgi:hypothetical protein